MKVGTNPLQRRSDLVLERINGIRKRLRYSDTNEGIPSDRVENRSVSALLKDCHHSLVA